MVKKMGLSSDFLKYSENYKLILSPAFHHKAAGGALHLLDGFWNEKFRKGIIPADAGRPF
ncbi:MAG: hypothetical protein ACRECJ_10130 [Limisphaerales bacterium]